MHNATGIKKLFAPTEGTIKERHRDLEMNMPTLEKDRKARWLVSLTSMFSFSCKALARL